MNKKLIINFINKKNNYNNLYIKSNNYYKNKKYLYIPFTVMNINTINNENIVKSMHSDKGNISYNM